MRLEHPHFNPSDNFQERTSLTVQIFEAVPIEGIAFIIASFAMRIFSTSLAFPLVGIGLAIITTRLVLKVIDRYDNKLLVNLTKEACKFNRNYPKLQMIIFICTLVFSFVSKTLSFSTGACLGSFGSIILDVENYKLQQQANRQIFNKQG